MGTREILKKFLSRKFNGVEFTENDLCFLEHYSIKKDVTTPNEFLKKLGINEGYDKFRYKNNNRINNVIVAIKQLYDRFYKKLETDPNAFDNKFENYISWCLDQEDDNGNCHCYYCGIDNTTVRAAFDKENGVLSSKKPSFNGSMQIERLDSEDGYNSENCRFTCVLCNNTKSDMISSEDFEKHFAPSIAKYWEVIKEKMSKK